MTNKHPALRLAEMTDVTDRSVIWQKWKQDACEQLRTQHALLERAMDALAIADRSLCEMEHHVSGGDDEINLEPAILTVRAALAALNQHLDQQ